MSGLEAHRFAGTDQFILNFDDSLAHLQARAQFLRVKWLRQVVIGAGRESFQQVAVGVLRGEENDISVVCIRPKPGSPADLHSIQLGHHPVEQRNSGRLGTIKGIACFGSIACGNNFKSPFLQECFQHPS